MCIDQLLSGLTKTTRHARPRVCAVGIHPTRNRGVTAVIIQLSRRAYFDFDSCTRGIAAVARKSTRSFPFIYRGRTERCFRHESYAISTHTHSGYTAASVTSKYHHHFAHQMQFTWAHVTMIWLNVQHWQLPFHIHRHLHQLNRPPTALLRPETLQKWRIMTTRWRINSPYSVDYFHNHRLCVCTRLCILYITDTGDVKCFSRFFILVTFLRI